MRIRILSVIALLTLVWPATARAGSISLDTFFQGVGGTFVVAGQAEEFFVHGSVQMSNANGLGDLDALPSFEAFCVDFTTSIFDVPPPGDGLGTYNAELGSMVGWVDGRKTAAGVPDPLASFGSGQRAAWLYNEYVPGLAAIDPTGFDETGLIQRAALQMAIWNALYDSDFTVSNNGLSDNHTYYTSVVRYPDLLTYANGYLHGLELAGAEVLTADAAWIQLTYTDGRDAQDFIGPTSVPEPSAGLLLGMGMMGLVAFRSRKSLLRRG